MWAQRDGGEREVPRRPIQAAHLGPSPGPSPACIWLLRPHAVVKHGDQLAGPGCGVGGGVRGEAALGNKGLWPASRRGFSAGSSREGGVGQAAGGTEGPRLVPRAWGPPNGAESFAGARIGRGRRQESLSLAQPMSYHPLLLPEACWPLGSPVSSGPWQQGIGALPFGMGTKAKQGQAGWVFWSVMHWGHKGRSGWGQGGGREEGRKGSWAGGEALEEAAGLRAGGHTPEPRPVLRPGPSIPWDLPGLELPPPPSRRTFQGSRFVKTAKSKRETLKRGVSPPRGSCQVQTWQLAAPPGQRGLGEAELLGWGQGHHPAGPPRWPHV